MEIKNCISFQKRHKDHLGNNRELVTVLHGIGNVTQYRTVGKGLFGGDPVSLLQDVTIHSSQGKIHSVYVNSSVPNNTIDTFISLFGGKVSFVSK